MPQVKCVLLYSGGLDSLLTAKILMDMGIDVAGLHCILPYFPPDLNTENLKSVFDNPKVSVDTKIGILLLRYIQTNSENPVLQAGG